MTFATIRANRATFIYVPIAKQIIVAFIPKSIRERVVACGQLDITDIMISAFICVAGYIYKSYVESDTVRTGYLL